MDTQSTVGMAASRTDLQGMDRDTVAAVLWCSWEEVDCRHSLEELEQKL